MTRIDELMEDLAGQAAPPTRMTADELYEAGRRRHRWQHRARLGTAMTGGVVVLGVWAAMLTMPGVGDVLPWGGSPSSAPAGGAHSGIAWAGAADPAHLYATLRECDAAEVCGGRLLGSDDGGRTWTLRSTQVLPEGPRFADAQTLFAWKTAGEEAKTGLMPSSYATLRPLLSTDGGRTWSELAKSATPVASIPADALVECIHDDEAPVVGFFKAYVVDLAARRVAPLAQQPGLRTAKCQREVPGLWYTGMDTSTPTHRPAVAYSKDSGRTWLTHGFDCVCSEPRLYSNDGQTLYAAMMLEANSGMTATATSWSDLRVFRSVDGGATWQPFALPDPPAPAGPMDFILRLLIDGTFAVRDTTADRPETAWWILRDGAWERPTINGMPELFATWKLAGGAGYLGYSTGYDIYLSPDWFTWTRVTVG